MIVTIKNRLKIIFDKVGNERLKNNFLQALPFWTASIITGLVAVLYARLFTFAERGTAFILNHHVWWLFIVTPVCFIMSWWLVAKFSPYARGSGIPQVSAAIELANPRYIDKVKK